MTGAESHLSAGFMMRDTRYLRLYFIKKLWPDFTDTDLEDALNYYMSLERRLGV